MWQWWRFIGLARSISESVNDRKAISRVVCEKQDPPTAECSTQFQTWCRNGFSIPITAVWDAVGYKVGIILISSIQPHSTKSTCFPHTPLWERRCANMRSLWPFLMDITLSSTVAAWLCSWVELSSVDQWRPWNILDVDGSKYARTQLEYANII